MSNFQQTLKRFFAMDAAAGIVLAIAALLAMIVANSPLQESYEHLLHFPIAISFGDFVVKHHLLHWINDGLMAVFFFLVGLELKREMMVGELSNPRNIILPALAAMGGMVFPALIYLMFNYQNPDFAKGWAIPAATDIAFALGVLNIK